MRHGLLWTCLLSFFPPHSASGQMLDDPNGLSVSTAPGLWESSLSFRSMGSELDFSGLTIGGGQIGFVLDVYELGRNTLMVSGELAAGRVLDGAVRYSDYVGATEWSRSRSEATGSSLASGAVGVGLLFPARKSVLKGASVWLGYSWTKLTIRIQNGVQIIPIDAPEFALIGLDSRFRAILRGPWAAVEPTTSFKGVQVSARLSLHLATDYKGEGRWNLRKEYAQPRSFLQRGDGLGLEFHINARVPIGSRWSSLVRVGFSRFGVDGGLDRTFFADGRVVDMAFQDVGWQSTILKLGMERAFW